MNSKASITKQIFPQKFSCKDVYLDFVNYSSQKENHQKENGLKFLTKFAAGVLQEVGILPCTLTKDRWQFDP